MNSVHTIITATLITLALTACDQDLKSDYTQGLQITTEGNASANTSDIMATIQIVEDLANERTGNDYDLLKALEDNGVEIRFTSYQLGRGCKAVEHSYGTVYTCIKNLGGITLDNGRLLVIKDMGDCIAQSALAHELLHVYQDLLMDTPDKEHKMSMFFANNYEDRIKRANTVEFKSAIQAIFNLDNCIEIREYYK